MIGIKKTKEEKRNNRMFLLENKLQSFYDEIKQLNEFSFQNENIKPSIEENSMEGKKINSNGLKENISERDSKRLNSINSISPINKVLVKNPRDSNFDYKKNESIYIETEENGNQKNFEEYDIVKLLLIK